MFGLIVICNWLTIPMAFWRIIIGPIEESKVYWAWCFVINFYTYGLFLPGMEQLLVKFLSIVILKRIPPIQDDFFGWFLLQTNTLLASMFAIINCYTVGPQKARRRFQGFPMETADFTPMMFK